MNSIKDVAIYLYARYRQLTGVKLDEMKLHKLLYFTQREALAVLGDPAFESDLEGWKYGPVSPEARRIFKDIEELTSAPISEDVQHIVSNVIMQYGSYESWYLSQLSHAESSWCKSREGLTPGDNGCRRIADEDIREDAKKVRLYDPVWDMYYDEFDDA